MPTEQSSQKRSTILCILGGGVLALLMGGAVISTASAAQLSFQAGELQQEEYRLKQREQYLQEQLAQAQSLQTLKVFAEEQSLTQPGVAVAELDLQPQLAQAR